MSQQFLFLTHYSFLFLNNTSQQHGKPKSSNETSYPDIHYSTIYDDRPKW